MRLRYVDQMRALIVLLVLPISMASAQEAVPTRPIKAQPLTTALTEFAQQTGLQIFYVSSLAQAKHSHAVPAGLPVSATLTQLLDGTGLEVQRLNDRAFRLRVVDPASVQLPVQRALDEVVVVASNREQRLMTVPLSAHVVTTEELAAYGFTTVEQALSLVPGVEYNVSSQWGAGLYNRVSMRGIVAERGASTTVVYLDDTAFFDALTPRSTFTVPYPALFDLDRVEILRGPQGVDFGAGAEGGAIRFIPKRANTWESAASVGIETGTIDGGGTVFEASAVVAHPLVSDRLGIRVGAYARDEGGFVDRINPFTGAVVDADSNRSSRRAARVSLDYEPTEHLSIIPSVSVQTSRMHDSPVFYVGLSNPGAGIFRNGKLMSQPYTDTLTVGALRVDQRWPGMTLTSVTSYVGRDDRAVVDQTNEAGAFYFGGFGSPEGPEVPVSYENAVTDRAAASLHMWSQELRLVSSEEGRRLVWSGGLYYAGYLRRQSDYSYLAPLPDTPAISESDWDRTTEFNVFGQMRWSLTKRWKLGAGVRFGAYRTEGEYISGGFAQPEGEHRKFAKNADSLPRTPRFDVTYQINSDWMVYAEIARGARVGRGKGPFNTCAGQTTRGYFGTDSLWNYEVGTKGTWWNGVLAATASLYESKWNDVQISTYDPCGHSYIANAGRVVSRGMDFSLQARPSEHWAITLDLAVGDTFARDTVTGIGGLLVVERGSAMPGAPNVPSPWSGTISVQYSWKMAEKTKATLRSLWVARSRNPGPFPELNPSFPTYDPRFAADPATYQGNMSVGIEHDHLGVNLYVDNVLNSRPTLQLSGDAPGTPLLYAYTARPRTIGLSFSLRN
jgi:outer membrane receptor protein involved in Fe transport